ncbi:unnamed protein product [Hyaloperonospora brassicae]|uniref:Uncharacterized protein n=1 Tax=Hyaloperonospora brassicae TaxID=162125 RepID=A0AAV0UX47_HYABA|nr:unnamed protein product [Hyaloperonospora brassicae]
MIYGRLVPLVVLGLPLAALTDGAVDAPTSGLRQVIVLSRHGVRGPYGMGTEAPSKEMLEKYVRNPSVTLPLSAYEWGTSETEDPAETVSPKLTKHGFYVVERMGKYFRDHLYREFLNATCDETFAYADNNERDNVTAVAFLSGLYPLCKDLVPMTTETRLLFEQGQDPTAKCPVCSKAMYEGITGSNDTTFVLQDIREEVTAVNDLLQCCATSVCNLVEESASMKSAQSSATCDLFGIPTTWNGAFYMPWSDTLSNANYFSEWLLLQSLNNMSLPSQFSFETILSLAKIHETHMDLITNEINSASFGATLLAHLTASFEQNILQKALPVAKGDGPHLAQGPNNRLLYYAAHDINLLYVRNLLRLQWYTKGWHPHQPVPGSMLVFELHATPAKTKDDQPSRVVSESRKLESATATEEHASWRARGESGPHRDNDSRFYVKLYFVAASPAQIRNGDKLGPENPPDRVQVTIPSCSEEMDIGDGTTDIRCPFSTFKKLIGKTLKHACVADTLRPFVESLVDNERLDRESAKDRVRGVNTSDFGSLDDSPEAAAVLDTLVWAVSSCLVFFFVVLLQRHNGYVDHWPVSCRRAALFLLLLAAIATAVVAAHVDAKSSSRSSRSQSDDNDSGGIPSLSELNTYDALAIALMTLGLAVSSAGRVSSGVILVPVMVLVMSFEIKRATPVANVAILGGAVANAASDRPLIDVELALGMVPVAFGGTVLGAVMNNLLPSYVRSLLFVAVLAVGGSCVPMIGIRLHKNETRKEAGGAAEDVAEEDVADVLSSSEDVYVQASAPSKEDSVGTTKHMSRTASTGIEVPRAAALDAILEKERRFAWGSPRLTVLVCCLGIVAASIGGASVACGGVANWVLLAIETSWDARFVVLTSRYLHKVCWCELAVQYEYKEGDVIWTAKTVVYFPPGCAVAGIVASVFGVGGGIVAGSIVIELGVVLGVASSTTALMIFYASAAATAKFAVFETITWD